MGTDNLDELETRRTLPPAVSHNASNTELARAVNGLAVEVQLLRDAFREQGTRIETFCERIEKAVEAMKGQVQS